MPIDLGEDAGLLKRLRNRALFISIAFAFLTVIIVGRLWSLQVLRADYFTELCEQNRIRIVIDEAPRGMVFDRNGEQIVGNKPSFDVVVDRGNRSAFASLEHFIQLANIPERKTANALRTKNSYRTVSAIQDVGLEALSILEEHRVDLPGLEVATRPKRRYVEPTLACHTIGYLGEATKAEIERSDGRIKLGDRMGRSGVELLLDNYLRGSDGRRLVETNAMGRVLRTLRRAEMAIPGKDVQLTIDLELQEAIEEFFDVRKGAIVVIAPKTGEVLAIVSRPAYDLDAFQGGVSAADWRSLRDDPDSPMSNRCISGQYPPGSTFKPVVALAALQTGAIKSDELIGCSGVMRLGPDEFHCGRRTGHGEIPLRDAIIYSCNIFFYRTGLACGIGPIAWAARQLGLGAKTQFELSGEMPGYIPAEKNYRDYWPGDVVSAAIGQGRILVTPIQMAVAFSAIANGGEVLQPHVISRVISPEKEEILSFGSRVLKETSIDPSYLALVRDALAGVVNEKGGTGWRARLDFPKVAGKTGTAQVVPRVEDEDATLDDIPYERRPHSWFVGFAPADDPEIAFAVLVEHGGSGGHAAATFAGKVVRAAFPVHDLEGTQSDD
ncbi:MAG: penicillin-binding protein 2 [Candidatus Coatesbacteria bacterium]|nr:penicillin-binding protein 2 [Candidatus Coatesbacteria bacterium]